MQDCEFLNQSTLPGYSAPLGAPLDSLAIPASPWYRLLALLRTERRDLRVVAVYAVASGFLSLAVPLAVQALVNSIAFTNLLQPVFVLSVVLFGALTMLGGIQAMQAYVVEIMQRRIFVRVALDLAVRLPRVKREAFDETSGPELVNRFFSVFTIQKSAGLLLLDGAALVLQTSIGLVLLAFYHPALLQFDLLLIAGLVFILTVLGRRATDTSLVESKKKFAIAAWLEELARHPGSFKAEDAARFALARTDALASNWLVARRDHWGVLLRQLLGLLTLQAFASSLLLGVGGWLVVSRQLTLGQLVAAEFVVASVVAGLVKLAKHLETFYDLLASVDKLGSLLDLPLDREGGATLPAGAGPAALTLRGVGVQIPGGPAILDHMDWDVAPGARVGVAGATGAGLSTLADLITGLREPAHGAIELDAHDLRDLSLRKLRQDVVAVRAEGVFPGTISENVQLGRPAVELSIVRSALEAVGLWGEVADLPAGLATPLAAGGWPLSPGEAGRLVLARAIAGRPRLIVIDGLLDALDAESRAIALDALFRPDAPWTLIALSRHPEVLARCELRYVLDKGRLVHLPGPAAAAVEASRGKKRRRA